MFKIYKFNHLKIIYACCFTADLELDIDYVDIIPNLKKKCGNYICNDIRSIDLSKYDIIIGSPPCNYYSRANYRRDISNYSLKTKELLPYLINEAYKTGKPFIIENVRNKKFMYNLNIPSDVLIYELGRHTYFTNVFINLNGIIQYNDNIAKISSSKRQGGKNVNDVFRFFIHYVKNCIYN